MSVLLVLVCLVSTPFLFLSFSSLFLMPMLIMLLSLPPSSVLQCLCRVLWLVTPRPFCRARKCGEGQSSQGGEREGRPSVLLGNTTEATYLSQ